MSDLLSPGTSTRQTPPVPAGRFVVLDGEEYYQISDYDRMPPFLMSVPGDADLWMFLSSAGGLTAGRWNADGSLFPYETVDRLHRSHNHTGSVTLVRAGSRDAPSRIWEPFTDRASREFQVSRNLYKNATGNRVLFEEINHSLGLTWRSRWSASDELGIVRTGTLTNSSSSGLRVAVLDGFRNVLPYGAPLALYQTRSSLVDAYKRTDCDPDSQLGIFSLTSRILDRAEAAEELRANTVWSHGLHEFGVHLSAESVEEFREGETPRTESVRKGRPGSYLVTTTLGIDAGSSAKWHLVADIGRGHIEVAKIRERILEGRSEGRDLDLEIERSLTASTQNLRRNVASSDGLQLAARTETTVHHFANVLFNNMRGGVFVKNYDVPARDFQDFVGVRNRPAALRHRALLESLPDELGVEELLSASTGTGDPDLERLAYEYLPLHFGRRHGDPSRPWNRFELRMRHDDGSQALNYEGNWRDIFQNWEALGFSFPRFLPNFVAKFVNASTVDGFNPYRITRDGFEWERVDPDDPWSYIGYWGDHQIVYLLRLLELLERTSPDALSRLLPREIFSYAEVPYRIRSYDEIVRNPHETIEFDSALDARIEARVQELGTDGALIRDSRGTVYHVSLMEKLLVPALAKISNLVPDGGIWMNTQRPEWNDANNALVGRGVSVVTLCHLRRYLGLLEQLVAGSEGNLPVSVEVIGWFDRLTAALRDGRDLLRNSPVTELDRRGFLDRVGSAFSSYRTAVYAHGFSGKAELSFESVGAFCRLAILYLDAAIQSNRRPDGLYHSYNLLEISVEGRTRLGRLYEMLEGQVAALGSGLVSPSEAAGLLRALFQSRMYRETEQSFLLYPERELPGFLERNIAPEEKVRAIPLLRVLLSTESRAIVSQDAMGVFRFHPDLTNAAELSRVLDEMEKEDRWHAQVRRDREAILALYESVFDHTAFTGRSGTMYGFEGLGCVYWHMVAKLLLAVQEIILASPNRSMEPGLRDTLIEFYYRIRSGLGYERSVDDYGAFPTDPYSHTPPHGGASQPGMTGQVKEEVLTRFGELGVRLEEGVVGFDPVLLQRSEFRGEAGTFRYYDVHGEERSIPVPAGSLAFTYCQTPVLYTPDPEPWVRVTTSLGESVTVSGSCLAPETSSALLDRSGEISRIEVGVRDSQLREGGSPV